MDLYLLAPIFITLLFSAFFSGMEIAFISADKLHIELQENKGPSEKILSKFIKNPSRFIGTTLVGNTLALVLYGIYMAQFLDPFIRSFDFLGQSEALVLIIQTLISTLIVLLTAEFLPKSIFLIDPNYMLKVFAWPMNLIYSLMSLVVLLITSVSKWVLVKVFGLEYEEDRPAFGLTDLNHYVNKTREDDDEAEIELDKKIFNNALEFKKIRVRECMIPRTEIVAVDINDKIEELSQAFSDSGHSKILVYKESIDNVIGFCHSLELFKKPKTIEDILTPIKIVPETLMANELMIQFIEDRKSLALVVDEYGGTSGIVSIEDIIEEIFGEIQDEHDEDDLIEQKLNEHTYLLSARHEIDYLNEKYEWELPTGDYETLGGLILNINEDLPELGDTLDIEPYTFTIQDMNDIRIESVKLIIDKNIAEV